MRLACANYFFSSCDSLCKKEVKDVVANMYGQRIDYGDWNVPSSTYSILTYIDSTQCTECQMQIRKWQKFLNNIGCDLSGTLQVVFVVHNKSIGRIKHNFRHAEASLFFVIADTAGRFIQKNELPQNDMFRTFLLDSANHIVAIGNPIYSSNIAKLYMDFMGVEAVSESSTYAQNLGTFNWREPQTVSFKIANQSDEVWRIDSITTSCECTTAKCSQHEVLPHDSLKVEVCYAAESASTFMREVYVHTNHQNEPITLTIEGSAVEQCGKYY